MLRNINFYGVLTRAEPGTEDGVRMWVAHKLDTASEDPAATGKSWPDDSKGHILQEHQTGKHSNVLKRKWDPDKSNGFTDASDGGSEQR